MDHKDAPFNNDFLNQTFVRMKQTEKLRQSRAGVTFVMFLKYSFTKAGEFRPWLTDEIEEKGLCMRL
jgi:hypothetical protein